MYDMYMREKQGVETGNMARVRKTAGVKAGGVNYVYSLHSVNCFDNATLAAALFT